ncbi:TIGR03617 family F420-dependent LLM class oxidoreductase [Nocardioides sp. NPDC023903]|uniref:TIGR03617 family F420-dependent LLM class oxidoreductase n=1 Tax=Nocardioides sp. NPDC023903 TaxID=3157195 RepID=UPI0033D9701C
MTPLARLEVDLRLDAPPEQVAARAQELAATGVAGLFTFEGAHDPFLSLAVAATNCGPIDLMTNVAIALPRSPVHLAHAAYDLQVLSQGRFRLGLGSQVKAHIERRHGSTWDRPAAQMRDRVQAVKAVLDSWQYGTPLAFAGSYTRIDLMPRTFDPGPNPFGTPPVLLGALGPVMTRTAAEVADGLLVMPFNTPRHFSERTLPAIEEGLRRREGPGDFSIHPQAILAMADDPDELSQAIEGVRRLLAFYASTPAYRPVLEVEGRPELQLELGNAVRTGDLAAKTHLIDDGLLSELAIVGTPEDCARQLIARFGSYAQRVCCYFPGHDPSPALIAELVAALAPPSGAAR